MLLIQLKQQIDYFGYFPLNLPFEQKFSISLLVKIHEDLYD